MSKLKLLTIAVIGLLAINIGVVSFLLLRKPPLPPAGRPSVRKENGPKKLIIERLHFDKDQVAAYEILIARHQVSVKGLKDSIIDTKNSLYQCLKKETFDDKDSLINVLGVLQKRIESVHFEHFTQIKKLCKPEQIEDFNKLTKDLGMYFTTEKKVRPSGQVNQ
jgi:periplasmic protein CpxP/Spy